MEQSSYVDVTLDLTRRLKQEFPAVGVCLQAYLFRTRQDLEDVISRGIGVRLVKGAYNEPRGRGLSEEERRRCELLRAGAADARRRARGPQDRARCLARTIWI